MIVAVHAANTCLLPTAFRHVAGWQDAEETRQTLGRLKRMAGFEGQDFDPMVGAEVCVQQRTDIAAILETLPGVPHRTWAGCPCRLRTSTAVALGPGGDLRLPPGL